MNTILKVVLCLIVISGNALSFWIKRILKDNGYEVKFFTHSRDTRNLFKLAKTTEDKTLKRKCLFIGLSDIFLGIVFIISSILMAIKFFSL